MVTRLCLPVGPASFLTGGGGLPGGGTPHPGEGHPQRSDHHGTKRPRLRAVITQPWGRRGLRMVSFPRLVHGEAHFSLLLPPFALKAQNETLKIRDGKAITGESVICIRGKRPFPVGDKRTADGASIRLECVLAVSPRGSSLHTRPVTSLQTHLSLLGCEYLKMLPSP